MKIQMADTEASLPPHQNTEEHIQTLQDHYPPDHQICKTADTSLYEDGQEKFASSASGKATGAHCGHLHSVGPGILPYGYS